MGRCFTSIRPGIGNLTDTWQRNTRKPGRHNRKPDGKLTRLAKKHSGKAFFGCDSTPKAELFSLLIEISRIRTGGDEHVDP